MGLSSQGRLLIHAAQFYTVLLFMPLFLISPMLLVLVFVFPWHRALRVNSMSQRQHRYATLWRCFCSQGHLTIWRTAWQNSSETLKTLSKALEH